jgi:hypothetical protein
LSSETALKELQARKRSKDETVRTEMSTMGKKSAEKLFSEDIRKAVTATQAGAAVRRLLGSLNMAGSELIGHRGISVMLSVKLAWTKFGTQKELSILVHRGLKSPDLEVRESARQIAKDCKLEEDLKTLPTEVEPLLEKESCRENCGCSIQ